MLRVFLPRVFLALVMLALAYFSYFESVYLHDQAVEFGQAKIAMWMWVFRGAAAGCVIACVAIVWLGKGAS